MYADNIIINFRHFACNAYANVDMSHRNNADVIKIVQ